LLTSIYMSRQLVNALLQRSSETEVMSAQYTSLKRGVNADVEHL
jgi:hypothetical protein